MSATESLATGYVGIAGFTVLIWDHIDTFTTEVTYIWLGEKSLRVNDSSDTKVL
ncbi:hypothetical protein E1B28_012715 [Marasmius oreades]|uniref:DUF6533 domain-containing protein n=1 Tax=Marasmius oreades TaxID=181124 RepID=A0A9P7RSP1_9AGAR|nr:uncharacterized protein E1B28_012715 [Marasmius oreades]KAG7088747.1 hypothetical protein E1B28_012715 [Marasmius oreades]